MPKVALVLKLKHNNGFDWFSTSHQMSLYLDTVNSTTPSAVKSASTLEGDWKVMILEQFRWHFKCYFDLENGFIIREFSKWKPC